MDRYNDELIMLSKNIWEFAEIKWKEYKSVEAQKEILKNILKSLNAIPAQRDGKDLAVLRDSIKLIKTGKILGIFPEGTRVKEIKRENIKDGAGYIALKSKTDILTIEIISSYKPFCKTDLYIKNLIQIEDFEKYKSKDAMEKIMDKTYEKMYENHKFLRKV